MIHVRDLTKRFGGAAAVDHMSFEAGNGTITGLLGANGAGKTTTLRMICGVLRPDAGSVYVDSVASGTAKAAPQHSLGALLDHTGLYARLTARENLAYFGRLRGIRAQLLEARVSATLSMLGLQEVAGRRVGGFSQGERMKVALGRVLVHDPTNILLDEPTNGLDVPTVRKLRLLLRELRDAGACVILSSHVLGEVEELCDRLLIMARGSILAEGTTEEVRRRAATDTLEEAFLKLTGVGCASC